MPAVPEDRARTIGMCKRLGIWPLDAKHKPAGCLCPRCFAGEDELAPVRAKRNKPKAFFWEEDAA